MFSTSTTAAAARHTLHRNGDAAGDLLDKVPVVVLERVGGGVRGHHGDAGAEDNAGVRAEAVVIRGGHVDDVATPGLRDDRR